MMQFSKNGVIFNMLTPYNGDEPYNSQKHLKADDGNSYSLYNMAMCTHNYMQINCRSILTRILHLPKL